MINRIKILSILIFLFFASSLIFTNKVKAQSETDCSCKNGGKIISLDKKTTKSEPTPTEAPKMDSEKVSQIISSLFYQPASDGGQPTGIIPLYANIIGVFYKNPPASFPQYVAYLKQNFGLGKPAYAQEGGIGFNQLVGLLPFWKIFRNTVYILYVFFFAFAGLAITLRMKVSERVLVTIESALPQLVISLLLVTFSYAIAGLMVDLIYVVINLVLSIFEFMPGGLVSDATREQHAFMTPPEVIIKLVSSGLSGIFNLVISMLVQLLKFIKLDDFLKSIAPLLIGSISNCTWTLFKLGAVEASINICDLIKFILGAGTLLLILWKKTEWILLPLTFILDIFFKLLAELVECYLNIILLVIFGPVLIAASSIPGVKSEGFKNWIVDLFSNCMVFAALPLYVFLGNILTRPDSALTWSPPGLSIEGTALFGLISLGFLILVPSVPPKVKSFIAPKKRTEDTFSDIMKQWERAEKTRAKGGI